MKIALIGYGKMGKMIEEIAVARGHEIVSIIDVDNEKDFDTAAFKSAQVAIEFTNPQSAFDNFCKASARGVKVVSGTTGWFESHKSEVEMLCAQEGKTLLWASNFSLGVALFRAVNRFAARLIDSYPQYGVSMTETHHIHKLDSPSGTAITVADDICGCIRRLKGWEAGLTTACGCTLSGRETTSPDHLRIDSVREGEVAGIHSVRYSSDFDDITVTHTAHSRRGFALGAVMAAEYAAEHSGLLSIDDLFAF